MDATSLRTRFVVSHVLPLVVVIPLVGLLLLYVLETQFFLPALQTALARQAELIAALTEDTPPLWQSTEQAQTVVDHLSLHDVLEVVLIDTNGRVLTGEGAGTMVALPFPSGVLSLPEHAEARQNVVTIQDSGSIRTITVWVPVTGHELQPLGAVRLTQTVNRVTDDIQRLRDVIIAVSLLGLVIGGGLGAGLALQLERPLAQVTTAVKSLAEGNRRDPLPVYGPRELQTLTGTVNTLIAQLHALAQTRLQLLANLAHELNRPLGAMQVAVESLAGGASDDLPLRDELLTGVQGEIHRMQRLVKSLVDLHAGLSGPFALNRASINMNEWLPAVLAPYRVAAQAQGITVQTEFETPLPTLLVDPDRLGQLAGNLMDNALKYTSAGGTITITARPLPADGNIPHFILSIHDTGGGIADEDLAHIFTPFYRSRLRTRFPQGMGLGLTIARDVATAHGGTLTVTNQDDGARFTLTL